MALYSVVTGNVAAAADLNQIVQLLNGTTTNAPVTLGNQLLLSPGVAGAAAVGTWGSVPIAAAKTTFNNTFNSFTFNIPSTNLARVMIYVDGACADTAGVVNALILRFNNDSGINYYGTFMEVSGGTAQPQSVNGQNTGRIGYIAGDANGGGWSSSTILEITGISQNGSVPKHWLSRSRATTSNTAAGQEMHGGGHWNSISAISSIQIIVAGGTNFTTGGAAMMAFPF